MELIEVRPDDVDALVRIRERAEYGGESDRHRMSAYLAGTHHPRQALRPRVLYLARQGSDEVGFIAGHLTRRYDCDGELQWIVVAPDRRGGDVGTALLRRLATWFVEQGARRVCVDVDPQNHLARRFYRRHGAVDLNPHWLVWPDIGVVRTSEGGASRGG